MFDFSLLISDLTSILFLCFLPVPSVQKVGSELNRERRAKEELEKEKKTRGVYFSLVNFSPALYYLNARNRLLCLGFVNHQDLLTLVCDSNSVGVGVVGVGMA